MSSSALIFALVTVVLNGGAQLLLRKAALTGAVPSAPLSLLKNAFFMCGLVAYAASVLSWLLVLRKVPLSIAAPFIALVYVIVPLASRALFDDRITTRMWTGMVLVALGVTLVAKGAQEAPPTSGEQRD
ncbi:MAG TPA: EamA family transporter [Polyangiaceae bacterium]|nr:EamA family transporter [Polyangiaceae bacterium]